MKKIKKFLMILILVLTFVGFQFYSLSDLKVNAATEYEEVISLSYFYEYCNIEAYEFINDADSKKDFIYEELSSYCQENQINIDSINFDDFYTDFQTYHAEQSVDPGDSDCLMDLLYLFYSSESVSTPKNSTVSAVSYTFDWTVLKKYTYDSSIASSFPDVEKILSATRDFNCHSYALYSQSTSSNEIWINDPSLYYTDGSYLPVDTPQEGDIIVYYNSSNNNCAYLHSGIITDVPTNFNYTTLTSIDSLTVVSKWGSNGLYSHSGYDCPYVPNNPSGLKGKNVANEIKFYRLYTDFHQHSYDVRYVSIDNFNHKAFCSCGEYTTVAHDFFWDRNGYRCRDCSYFTSGPILVGPTAYIMNEEDEN